MTKVNLSNSAQVEQHIAKLPKDIQPTIEYLRQVMLSVDNDISEHIKWNSPPFGRSGQAVQTCSFVFRYAGFSAG